MFASSISFGFSQSFWNGKLEMKKLFLRKDFIEI